MQPAASQKKKYTMEEFISPNKANPMIKTFNRESFELSCICTTRDSIGLTCFKCKTFVHACLASKQNRDDKYQCCSCLNKALDPLVQVRKILVDSFFKTFPIFEYINIFSFEFTLTNEDLGFPVEVRGLFPDSTSLSWPMQGGFYLNDEKTSFHEFKPLLYNSNRKHRRQQYFMVPSDKLKIGKNFIKFKIPCLDRAKFTSKYQHQDKKIYYMAINSVQRLSPGDLQTQTFRERRVEKAESIKILTSNNSEIEVTKNKVCLICPYTRQRIKVPVRGKYCKHFSCICLQTLIVTHANSRHWGCPICQLKMNEPYVDVWIYNMLKDNQQGSQVTVNEDGTYEWVKMGSSAMMNLDSDDDSPPATINASKPIAKASQIKSSTLVKKEVQQKEITTKESKEHKQSIASKKDIPEVNVISLDDDEEEVSKSRKQNDLKKDMLRKVKDMLKEARAAQLQASKPVEMGIEPKKSKESLQPQENKKKQERPISKPKVPVISEIKSMECKEMKHEEFKKMFFKSKINPYRKYVQNEQLKRLFKDIL